MTPQLQVGDRVHARWRGNGDYYQATIASLELEKNSITLAWDDGDSSDRVVDIKDVYKISEESQPWDWNSIERTSIVKEVANKGRCLFTKNSVNSGDVIFIERPTLVAIPSKNQPLWDKLKQLYDQEPFSLGTITFHYASLLSVFTLSDKDLKVILDKFVPEGENEELQPEVNRILAAINVKDYTNNNTQQNPPNSSKLTPQLLQHLVNAWRYNSFGHHTEDGLVLYNRISMMAHSCDPSSCWTYGEEDSFVLRARVSLQQGQELTISYLQDDDLLKSTTVRRKKLENWKFSCACDRCMRPIDYCRGFRCLRCRSGAHYVVENLGQEGYEKFKDNINSMSLSLINATIQNQQSSIESINQLGNSNSLSNGSITNGQHSSQQQNQCHPNQILSHIKNNQVIVVPPLDKHTTGFELLTACDVCNEICKAAEREQCLSLEPEYINRIEGLDKTNISDVETVYNASLDFFSENHWCVFQCEHILYEYYKDKAPDLALTIQHGEKKVAYHSRVYPRPTFVWAWGLEELADNIQKFYKQCHQQQNQNQNNQSNQNTTTQQKSNNNLSACLPRASRFADCINLYRKAQCQLSILCGRAHPYTLAPQNKWHSAQQQFTEMTRGAE